MARDWSRALLVRATARALTRNGIEPLDAMAILARKVPGSTPEWRLAVIDEATLRNIRRGRARARA